jgi:hypothetical protein
MFAGSRDECAAEQEERRAGGEGEPVGTWDGLGGQRAGGGVAQGRATPSSRFVTIVTLSHSRCG